MLYLSANHNSKCLPRFGTWQDSRGDRTNTYTVNYPSMMGAQHVHVNIYPLVLYCMWMISLSLYKLESPFYYYSLMMMIWPHLDPTTRIYLTLLQYCSVLCQDALLHLYESKPPRSMPGVRAQVQILTRQIRSFCILHRTVGCSGERREIKSFCILHIPAGSGETGYITIIWYYKGVWF